MMTNNGSLQNKNMGNEPIPDYESLQDSLITPELDNSTIDDIIKAMMQAEGVDELPQKIEDAIREQITDGLT